MRTLTCLAACALAGLSGPVHGAPPVCDNAASTGDGDFRNAANWTAGTPEGSTGTATHPAMVQADAILSGGVYSTEAHVVVQDNATWTVDAGVSSVATRAVNQGKIFTSGANGAASSSTGTVRKGTADRPRPGGRHSCWKSPRAPGRVQSPRGVPRRAPAPATRSTARLPRSPRRSCRGNSVSATSGRDRPSGRGSTGSSRGCAPR